MRRLILLFFFAVSSPVVAQDEISEEALELAVQALTEGGAFLDPEDMLAWVDLPRSAKVGDTVTLRITVENGRESGDFELATVDLDHAFLDGFRIKSMTPVPEETDGSFGTLEMTHPMTIAPGESVDFVLELEAAKPGVFIGEVSIWAEEDFYSRYVQCKVVEK